MSVGLLPSCPIEVTQTAFTDHQRLFVSVLSNDALLTAVRLARFNVGEGR